MTKPSPVAFIGAIVLGLQIIPPAAAEPGPMNKAVHEQPTLPPLQLTDAQRDRIRQALSRRQTEINPNTKTVKPAAAFEPAVGAKLPSQLKAHPLPRPLVYEIPVLKRFMYVKFKHEVVIINPLTRVVAAVLPEV